MESLRLVNWNTNEPPQRKYRQYVKKEIKILGTICHEDRARTSEITWASKDRGESFEKQDISLFGKV